MLSKPQTNVQIMQQSILMKFSYLYKFLVKQSPEVSAEVRAYYLDTMSKLYYTTFKTYLSGLEKLKVCFMCPAMQR